MGAIFCIQNIYTQTHSARVYSEKQLTHVTCEILPHIKNPWTLLERHNCTCTTIKFKHLKRFQHSLWRTTKGRFVFRACQPEVFGARTPQYMYCMLLERGNQNEQRIKCFRHHLNQILIRPRQFVLGSKLILLWCPNQSIAHTC